ncbi:sugar transporter [Azospirillum sp. RWY-5-1]|uniref:Sugar transporter n=1 Tax=Azospirillum oleiclasticum TaxID=2735135 RepID=A0ABX2TEB5_9PROT|nr:SLBB domain-containing protein [Azospirillum oleiclasticum]NYZ14920.1 sugar transporter [Azospirillum oleiclasticum]NYZ22682.1 sugar transporter [Azospirillum oleiclasticum]
MFFAARELRVFAAYAAPMWVYACIIWGLGLIGQAAAASPSPIEQAYSTRAGSELKQFGYELFATKSPPAQGREPIGAVHGDYVLGVGDELAVTLRGQINSTRRYRVDGDGRLLIDELRPLRADGRTLDEFRRELAIAISAAHLDVETFVSVTEIRQIGVLVLGAVGRPGRQELISQATVFDALIVAGGVTRSGSLRRIKLLRGATERVVDVYELVQTGGGGTTERLRDGDRILVPPLGPTVAVAGPVKHPGIFELPAGVDRASVAAMRDLAGGLIRPATQQAMRLGLKADGGELAEEVRDSTAPLLGDGDILMLAPLREDRQGVVRLEGHVLRPGPRSIRDNRTLIDLVGERDLRPGHYRPFAALASTDRATGMTTHTAIDLAGVLDGRTDRRLAEGDTLIIFSTADVDFLTSDAVLRLLRGDRSLPEGACRGLVVLARTIAGSPDGPFARGPQAQAAAELTGSRQPCPPIFDENPDLLAFALQQSVLVRSGVTRPGFFPVAGKAGTQAIARSTGQARDKPATRAVAAIEPEGSLGRDDIMDRAEPVFELIGHVRFPGVRRLAGGTTLRAALEQGRALRDGVYPLMGVIERVNRRSLSQTLIAFSPQEVVRGRADRVLEDGDRVHLIARTHIRLLTAHPPAHDSLPPSVEELGLDPLIASLLNEHAVQVRGAVRQPGAYPVADRTAVESVITEAGGVSASGDPASVELTFGSGATRRETIDLTKADGQRAFVGIGDAVRVNPTFARMEPRTVNIVGEVRRPGRYDVLRGERLSALIARAGGLTDDAYPAGAFFSRESERRRKKEEFNNHARAIDAAIVRLRQKGEPIRDEQESHARQLAAELRGIDPPGRIVVEADPIVLRKRPELDILLEADDQIVIPKRPLTVVVSGELMAPAALQFVSGKTADDYIHEGGGTTRDADTGRSFLVLPDGRAEPLSISSWNHTVTAVPPGAMIVIPRDVRPYGFLELAKDIGGIVSQLALTAASITVISR